MDKLREEFEEWAANDRSELDVWQRGNKVGEYKNPVVGKMWKAWQASRASIVVELPSKSFYFGDNDLLKGAVRMVADRQESRFIESLRSIGLSIKGE
ncbi:MULTISPECIES: hypothetical protein [Serratia]|uniref:Phage protein n=1 Tax=Serratia nevei TaxID=2703794 RepID=A0ABT7GJW8_9GAMM|nr:MULTISPECIES: hypothetical protein [Serratia]MDK4799126.1 hypothetical protein [Serratia nevei]MDK4861388.1 hypothetical protein [Serratia nevei]MDK4941175.1 hypothetical protein [Serratia nevei]MDK5067348.1 hypothetical protein [Serratia nevei]MDK5111596.1 hypothetical protein [Serratia nevei]